MRFPDQTVSGVSDLLKKLRVDTRGTDNTVWYRGHYVKSWKLVPTLYRASGHRKDSEMSLIKKFRQNATLLVESNPPKFHDWLFLMRHHGVQTRLLDWTESPLVGMYFAVTEHPQSDGALWLLLPHALNKNRSPELNELPSFEEDNEFMDDYEPDRIEHAPPKIRWPPIAIIAPRNNRRMHAQLSVFTISHRSKTPIDKVGNGNHVWRYVIPAHAKTKIIKELEMLRVGKFQLFPELDSIGEMLRG